MEWKVRAIRGATTARENTVGEIKEVVTELLHCLEKHNQLDPEEIVSVIFTTTRDIDVIFPAAIARQRPGWDTVPLLDLQQMHVEGSLQHCIRVLIHLNSPKLQGEMRHCYLREAIVLRPEWS